MMFLVIPAAFLVAISILVAVHEFGHYWVAKKLGFKVLRFSIGFGKPLLTRVGKDADHTEYCLAAIPLGGYVRLLDEREGDVAESELHRSFTRRPISHRIAVLLAGPAMNLLFASLLYAVLAMLGTEVVKPVVGQVRLDSPAAVAGLQRGDQIVRVGQRDVNDTEELQIALIRQFSGDGSIPLRVRRDGIEQRNRFQHACRDEPLHRQRQRDIRAGDRSRARAAIGLDHVTIEPHGSFSQFFLVDDRPQRSPDQPLNFQRAPRRPSAHGFARRALLGRPRKHAVLARYPTLSLSFQERRHAVVHRRRANHPRVPDFNQHAPFGAGDKVGRHLDRADLIVRPSIASQVSSS